MRAVADLRPGQLALAGVINTPRGPAPFAVVATGEHASPDQLWAAVERRLDQLAPPPAAHVSRSKADE